MMSRSTFLKSSLLALFFAPTSALLAQNHTPRAVPVTPKAVPVFDGGDMLSRVQKFPLQKTGVADAHYNKSELVATREQTGVDRCAAVPNQKSFLNAMEGAVRVGMEARQIDSNSYVVGPYGLPEPEDSHPVSLMSNPLCIQDASQIADLLDKDFVPDAATIASLKSFSEASNEDRRRALAGDDKAIEAFNKRWTQFMGCLSYSESLQTADSSGVDDRFKRAVSSVPGSKLTKRPSGVLFAEDRNGDFFNKLRAQNKAGTLTPSSREKLESEYKPWPVVGIYQFDPLKGNTGPCVSQWNKINPACTIRSNGADVMAALSSPGQTFNTFCGVQKLVQAFNSQINTNKPTGVDPSNRLSGGRIKAPQDRCVSLVARAGGGRIYSHFGPLRNSVKDNLGKLMGCVNTIK